MNILKTRETIESFSKGIVTNKETEDVKKNHMEILELKNKITKIKNFIYGLNNKVEGTKNS